MTTGVMVLSLVSVAAWGVICAQAGVWQTPGCHRVGHTRTVTIPDCVEFQMSTNACRGFCVSYSIPSDAAVLGVNSNQVITSVGQCCNILESEDIVVSVMCLGGPRDVVFKSAVSCGCFHCKKN